MKHQIRLTLMDVTTGEPHRDIYNKKTEASILADGQIHSPISMIKIIRSMIPGISLRESKTFSDKFQHFLETEFKKMKTESDSAIRTEISQKLSRLMDTDLRDVKTLVDKLLPQE